MIFNLDKVSTRPVFVIATQRSGTNLLRKSLAQTELFCDLNEVFDPFHDSYWAYRTERIAANPELSVPAEENQLNLWHGFLRQRLLPLRKRFALIDIKYSSMHHLDTVWRDHGQMPILMRWLQANRFPVIHVVRENVLDTYVSNLLACKLKVWVADDPAIANDISFQLDLEETVTEVNRRQNEIQFFREQLSNANNIELAYDRLVSENRQEISGEILGAIYDLLDVSQKDRCLSLRVGTKKMGRSAEMLIKNFDAVDAALNVCRRAG